MRKPPVRSDPIRSDPIRSKEYNTTSILSYSRQYNTPSEEPIRAQISYTMRRMGPQTLTLNFCFVCVLFCVRTVLCACCTEYVLYCARAILHGIAHSLELITVIQHVVARYRRCYCCVLHTMTRDRQGHRHRQRNTHRQNKNTGKDAR